MTTDSEFVDHYEILEASCNASFETIESVFRFLAKRFHPDSGETGDRERFKEIVEAYETLRDPERRSAYDEVFQSEKTERSAILTLFYAQRRRDMKKPGIGISTLEHMVDIDPEVVGFHIWYFKERGWITREESGVLSITADGVDKIESTVEKQESASLIRIAEAKSQT